MKDELYHYGVKGQKWGIRRFVDENGNPTELGKHHYGYHDAGHSKSYQGKPVPMYKIIMNRDTKKVKKNSEAKTNNPYAKAFLDTYDKLKEKKISDIDAATLARARELQHRIYGRGLYGLTLRQIDNKSFNKDPLNYSMVRDYLKNKK